MTGESIPIEPVAVDGATLQAAEAAIGDAIVRRDASRLEVLGFGEIAVAVGWPTDAPEVVLKRTAVYRSRADCERHMGAVDDYVARLAERGAAILPTSTHVVERTDGRFVGYAAQPVVARSLLAETVLEIDEPRSDHPLLGAVRDYAVRHVTPELSVDMQIPNFAWDGDQLVLLDITTPIVCARFHL